MPRLATRCALFALAVALTVAGCGKPASTTSRTESHGNKQNPTESLTDQQKQEVRELNEQRQQEWGKKNK